MAQIETSVRPHLERTLDASGQRLLGLKVRPLVVGLRLQRDILPVDAHGLAERRLRRREGGRRIHRLQQQRARRHVAEAGCRLSGSTGVPHGLDLGPPQVESAPGTPHERNHSSSMPSARPGSRLSVVIPSSIAAAAAVCTHRISGLLMTRVTGGSPSRSQCAFRPAPSAAPCCTPPSVSGGSHGRSLFSSCQFTPRCLQA